MKYFSVFSGVGGFEIGIRRAYDLSTAERKQPGRLENDRASNQQKPMGTQPLCVGFSEIDKYASAVLRYNFPGIQNYGDITKIDWDTVPDFDLLVGGSPCQDLSVAGKRAGIGGSRSGLFGEYIRALEIKKPANFIWENVKGSMSSSEGWDFATILNSMAEAGYATWWQVLNAKDFGVPQNRERVFIVGSRNGSPREILFETGSRKEGAGTISTKTLRAHAGGFSEYDTFVRCPLRYLNRNQKNIEGDYAFTVDASQTAGVMNGDRVRRLTPRECERLMSWPDDWTRYGKCCDGCEDDHETSDTQRYKMCGNGVVSAVVSEVFKAHFC